MADFADSSAVDSLVAAAPAFTPMDRSLVESVLDYADSDDLQGVMTYCEAISKDGLARLVALLEIISPIAKSKLLNK